MVDEEEWREIKEAPDYEISSHGRVRRVNPDWQGKYVGRILHPSFCRGYARYILCVDGRKITRTAHSLVCVLFNGPKPEPFYHCAHRDGDKANNDPGNLYWATPKENAADRDRHGTVRRGPFLPESVARRSGDNHWTRRHPERVAKGASHWKTGTRFLGVYGERSPNSKLTEAEALAIKMAPRTHGSGRQLAEKYNVSKSLVSAIRHGHLWGHLGA